MNNTFYKAKALNILSALNCEARPIIDHYRLSKVSAKPFPLYSGLMRKQSGPNVYKSNNQDSIQHDVVINLLICGIGCQNMSTAVGWLAAKSDQSSCAWLNIGTAGHKTRDVGEVLRVHRSVDVVSGHSTYLPLVIKWQGDSDMLLTSNVVCTEYPQDAIVDMEGSAFLAAASQFTNIELVQFLKVISDNEQSSVERLNAQVISQLINKNIDQMSDFVRSLIELIPNQLDPSHTIQLLADKHCTMSQKQQYRDVMTKLIAMNSMDVYLKNKISKSISMKSLLAMLHQRLLDCTHNIEPKNLS